MQQHTGGRALRFSCVAVIIAALLVATPALATPAPSLPTTPEYPLLADPDPATDTFRRELSGKQAQLEALKAQLDELDREFAIAAEAYNRSADELESAQERHTAAENELRNAETAYEVQYDLLSDRAAEIYRAGELDSLDILLGAKSLGDFVSRLRFMNAIGASDADIAERLRAQRDQMADIAAELELSADKAASLEFELKARQIEVMIRMQERQELLDVTEAEIVALLEAEAERRRLEEAELMSEVLAGANRAGIVVEPGSPVETALAYSGVPYVWGGESPAGFDCSGLVLYVFKQHGVKLPHYSGSQYRLGEKVAVGELQPGDAVFFGSPVYHVGMYVGSGYFIHAPRRGDVVKLGKLAERRDYVGARRYPWQYRTGPILGAVADPATALD